MLPSIWGGNLFEDWPFEKDFFNIGRQLYGKHERNLMKADVKEGKDEYEVAVDVPGFKKEDVNISLEKGYLTISAQKNVDTETKDEQNNYIRRERCTGSCSRSFYVGDEISEKDIKAKMENGILLLTIPKKEVRKIEEAKHIEIE